MKKIISFIITILALSTLSSCSLFKPVQKRCPAYSLEIDQNNSDALLREAVIYKKKGDANEVAKIQSTLDDVDPNKAWILKNNKY